MRYLFYIYLCVLCNNVFAYNNQNDTTQIATPIDNSLLQKSVRDIVNVAIPLSSTDFNKANLYIDYAIQKAKKQKSDADLFLTYRVKGTFYEDANQLQSAKKSYEQALALSKKLTVTEQVNIQNDYAIICRKLGDSKVAKEYHLLTLDMAKAAGDQEMVELCYHGLGVLYSNNADFEQAISNYLKALEISDSRKDTKGSIITLRNLSNTSLRNGDNDRAQRFIERAYKLSVEVNDTMRIATVLSIYGKVLMGQKNLQGALAKYNEAKLLHEKLGDKAKIAEVLINISDVYVANNEVERAKLSLLESLASYKNQMSKNDLSSLYCKLGVIELDKENYTQAESHFQNALSLARQFGHNDLARNAYESLYQIYKNKDDYHQALIYLENARALSDSIMNTDKDQNIAIANFRYDVVKGEKDIQSLQWKQSRLIYGASTVVLLSLLMFLAYLSYLRGRNNKALQIKNEEIETQNKKLEDSNEILKQFAYAAAHDLKEPLRTIGSFISLIQKRYTKDLNADAQEYMTFVNNGVARMNNLLTELLNYSTLIAQQPTLEKVSLHTVIVDVTQNLQAAISAKNATIMLPNKLPSVLMNHLHINQLFQNLISNALKFVEGKPEIRINAIVESTGLLISVRDNGIGINPEYAQKVFQLFQQLEKQTYEGTGIGLTICKNIVDKYDGQIWFESAPNKGTTFYIRFPLKVIAP